MTIYTIGHSTRELDEFIKILQAYSITHLVDVRSIPKSRHTPQFNEENLSTELPKHHISYTHLEQLGGLRHSTKDSVNTGWRNTSFRGYADYMQTDDFKAGIQQLEDAAVDKTTAIMCAEAVPWRCHRSMIGDALLARKYQVVDIFDQTHATNETMTSFALIKNRIDITYPPEKA